MRCLVAIAVASLALGACQKQDSTASDGNAVSLTNASPEQVAAEAKGAGLATARFNPGQWETRIEMLSMDMPGMPGGGVGKQVMDKMLGEPMTVSSCMTPEEARKPNARIFSGKGDSSCIYRNFSMAGGKLDATLVCPAEGPGGETVMTQTGEFTGDSFALQTDMKVGDSGMRMKARVTGKRTGDCAA